jgi:regulator of replication initiation timing
MTRINSSVFASALTPNQRSFIEARLFELVDEAIAPLVTENRELRSHNKSLTDRLDTLETSLKNLERYIKDDVKYSLTRAKIVALMKSLGIK